MAYAREATVKPGIDKPRGNARRRYQTAQQYICIENDAHQRSVAMLGPDRATDSAKFDLDNPLDLSRIGVGVTLAHIANSFAKHRAIDRILDEARQVALATAACRQQRAQSDVGFARNLETPASKIVHHTPVRSDV